MGHLHGQPSILLLFALSLVAPRVRAVAWLAAHKRSAEKIADSRGDQSNRRDCNGRKKTLHHLQLLVTKYDARIPDSAEAEPECGSLFTA
jgi:hypothetical protein